MLAENRRSTEAVKTGDKTWIYFLRKNSCELPKNIAGNANQVRETSSRETAADSS
jgi:hypothetical protein